MNHIIFEQYSIECRKFPGIALVLIYFTLWLVQKKLAALSLPIRCKSRLGHPHLPALFGWFYFEFSLALKSPFLSSDKLVWLLRFWFTILNQKALYTKAETIQDFLEPLCTNLTQRYTYGITISCTLFMVCLPTMMITSCWASSIRQPLGAH